MTNETKVQQALNRAIRQAGSARAYARQLGVHETYIGRVRAGKQAAGPTLLEALGFRRTVVRNAKPLR